MATTRDERRLAFVNKVATEVARLETEGVVLAGNAFSSVCFLKGELSRQEREGAALLSGADGDALRASLAALGYAPDLCEFQGLLVFLQHQELQFQFHSQIFQVF